MATLTKRLRVPSDSELSRVLSEAAMTGAPVVVDTGEVVYTLDIGSARTTATAEPSHEKPSPDQVALSIDGIRKAAGSWRDIDAEAFKAYIRERRRTSSRPPIILETGR
jgi:hypothetical protein